MRVGLDISMLVYEGSGVATYTNQLVRHILKWDKKNHYRLFYSSLRKPLSVQQHMGDYRRLGGHVYVYPFPPWFLKIIWNTFQFLPVEWLIGKVDVYHSSDFLRPPLLPGTKGVTTIHDLTWKKFPHYHTSDIVTGHARKIKRTLAGNDVVIVDSQNTKKDLLQYYPAFKSRRVEVIPLGVGDHFKPITDQEKITAVLGTYQLSYPGNYLLYVGAIEPRKRVDYIIKLFDRYIQSDQGRDYKLLLVGRAGWKNEQIFQLVHDLGLQERIHFVGYVSDEDLPYFYNAARVFLYLSDYEGFGLPPLEALACGIPVLVAKNSSLTEVVPEKYLVDTGDINNMLTRLTAMLAEPRRLLHTHTWDRYADRFLEVLRLLNTH